MCLTSIAKTVIEATMNNNPIENEDTIKLNSNSRNFNNNGLSKVGPLVKFRIF